jgi:hypothetical protein
MKLAPALADPNDLVGRQRSQSGTTLASL